MEKKRMLALLMAGVMTVGLTACGNQGGEASTVTEEQYAAWAVEHGYVLEPEKNGYVKDPVNNGYIEKSPDIVASATLNKAGGVNYGAIEWDEELQATAVREFLKGGTYLGSADFAQDDSGYNYREMYQLATSHNNVPSNTNLELVLDASNLHLIGSSEANTGKTIEFLHNPNVSVSWCRQIRLAEEEKGYNYYASYGVQINGKVRIYTARDLDTPEGEAAILNCFDVYYPTLASTWGAYSAGMADAADEAAIKELKLAYARKTLEGGSLVLYEIIPSEIIVTAPFLMNMAPQMANAMKYATKDEQGSYHYDLFLTDGFLDKLVEYKANYVATAEGKAAVEEYYSTAMYQMLDGMCTQYGMPTNLELALNPYSAAGLKTQTTYIPQ